MNLDGMTKAELLELAKEKGLSDVSGLKKAELVEALTEVEEPSEEPDTPPEPPAEPPPAKKAAAAKAPEVTNEQLERIARASTEALEGRLESFPAHIRAAVETELKKRAEAREAAQRRAEPMSMMKVVKGGDLWRDGYLTTVPEGAIVDPNEGKRLEGLGFELVPCKARLEADAMGVKTLREV